MLKRVGKLISGVLLLAMVVYISGCGAAASLLVSNASISYIGLASIKGDVVVPSQDAQKVTTSSISALSSLNLQSMKLNAISKQSIKLLAAPTGLNSAEAVLCIIDENGSLESTGISTTVEAGKYTFSGIKEGIQYVVRVRKVANGQVLEMQAPAYVATGTTEANVTISPQTTVVAKAIIDEVVKVAKSNNIEPSVIAQLATAIENVVNTLITSGVIQVPSVVRQATEEENKALANVVTVVAADTTAKDLIDVTITNTKINTATESTNAEEKLANAKMFIKDLFDEMNSGNNNGGGGTPEFIIEALANKFVNNSTYSINQLVTIINSIKTEYSYGTLNADDIASDMSAKALEFYTMVDNINEGTTTEVGSVPKILRIILSEDKRDTFTNLTKDTQLGVPVTILIVNTLVENGWMNGVYFDPIEMMIEANMMDLDQNAVAIMGNDMRINQYWEYDPVNYTSINHRELNCYVNVYALDDSILNSIEVFLTYPTAAGGTTTLKMHNQQYNVYSQNMSSTNTSQSIRLQSTNKMLKANMVKLQTSAGPQMGKTFYISSWPMGATTEGDHIRDFSSSSSFDCTITVKDLSGNTLTTSTANVNNIDLSNVVIDLKTIEESPTSPEGWATYKPTSINVNDSGTARPVFEWETANVPDLPEGYSLAYVIDIYGPNGSVFSSWDNQQFIRGNAFYCPSELAVGDYYSFNIRAVVINDERGGWPEVEGGYMWAQFNVVNEAAQANAVFAINGKLDLLKWNSELENPWGYLGSYEAVTDYTGIKVALLKVHDPNDYSNYSGTYTWQPLSYEAIETAVIDGNGNYSISNIHFTSMESAPNTWYQILAWDGDGSVPAQYTENTQGDPTGWCQGNISVWNRTVSYSYYDQNSGYYLSENVTDGMILSAGFDISMYIWEQTYYPASMQLSSMPNPIKKQAELAYKAFARR